jgi:hypothetical protein
MTLGRSMPGKGNRTAFDPVAKTQRSKPSTSPEASRAWRVLASTASTASPLISLMPRAAYQPASRNTMSLRSTSPARSADSSTRL